MRYQLMLTDLINHFYFEKMHDVEEFLKTIYPFLVVSILPYGNFSKQAVAQKCSLKKVFLETSQNSQENTCARVSFLTKFHS